MVPVLKPGRKPGKCGRTISGFDPEFGSASSSMLGSQPREQNGLRKVGSSGCVLRRLVKAGGVVRAWVDNLHVREFACGVCQRVFHSLQAWSVHALRVHGQVQAARCYASCEQCPICLKQYATNVQLCSHIAYSSFCRHRLKAGGYVCEPQPGRGSKKAREAAEFLGSVKQGLGPHVPSEPLVRGNAATVFEDTPVWKALLQLLGACANDPAQTVLEKYRMALCTACMSPQLMCQLVTGWKAYVLSDATESLSVAEAAMHSAVAGWVCCNLSAAWLVPSHSQPAEHNATYRQSAAGLAALELDAVTVPPPVRPPHYDTLVVCHEHHSPQFLAAKGSSVTCITVKECCLDFAWCDRIWSFLGSSEYGFPVLCSAGIQLQGTCPPKPIKAAAFRQQHRLHTVLQDAILLSVELWLRAVPFAALLPCPDGAIRATLKTLPLLHWVQGSELLLSYNVPEAAIPEVLFHLL